MKFVLKTSAGGYYEGHGYEFGKGFILTNTDPVMAKEFSLSDFRNGVVASIVYEASTKYGLHFSAVAIEEEPELPESYETIFNVFKNQLSKGVEKYGQDVDKSNLSTEEWVDHSLEEIADLMVYLVKLKEKLKEMTKND